MKRQVRVDLGELAIALDSDFSELHRYLAALHNRVDNGGGPPGSQNAVMDTRFPAGKCHSSGGVSSDLTNSPKQL
jgi:hypothetical protein